MSIHNCTMECSVYILTLIEQTIILLLKFAKEKKQSKTVSKNNTAFDHFDNTLLVLSATTGGVSVALFVTVIGAAF